jgi:signal transduction histidine kinase
MSTDHTVRTERLVSNLVDNAVRHNRRYGRIEISTRVRDGHAVLSITNDGPTIPPSEFGRLFEPLQRLDTARARHPDGHGLGLSIVHAIATAHAATVVSRARPEGGLHLEVDFPSTVPVPERTSRPDGSTARGASSRRPSPLRRRRERSRATF